MAELWVIEYARGAGADLPAGAEAWCGLDGTTDRAYLPAPTRPGPNWTGLERLLLRAVASADAQATHHYIVETEVLPEHEAEFNDWYASEHLPGLAAVPGTVRAARYRLEGRARYLAAYDLTGVTVLGSAPWLAVRHTSWSSRVRPWFRHTRRLMYAAAAVA